MALGCKRQLRVELVGGIAAPARPSNSLNQRCTTFARPTAGSQLRQKEKVILPVDCNL
jgi:hypothetical protein